jgi:hypothetical protein
MPSPKTTAPVEPVIVETDINIGVAPEAVNPESSYPEINIDVKPESTNPQAKGGVYTLTNGDKVVRVGQTSDFDMREKSYKYDKNYFDLKFNRIFYTDDYAERRGLEKYLFDINKEPPLNKNRPIRPDNPNMDTYVKAASEFLAKLGIKWP